METQNLLEKKEIKKEKHYARLIPKFQDKLANLTKKREAELVKIQAKFALIDQKTIDPKKLKKAKKEVTKAKKAVKKINAQNLSYVEMVQRYDFKILLSKLLLIICVTFCAFSIIAYFISGNGYNPFKNWS